MSTLVYNCGNFYPEISRVLLFTEGLVFPHCEQFHFVNTNDLYAGRIPSMGRINVQEL